MVIGLTGGIGAGKSTAARILSDLGAQVINADQIGHTVYAPGTKGWELVVREFGCEIVAEDGTIDRKRLGTIVFADAKGLDRLNKLLHPMMGEVIRRQIEAGQAAGRHSPIVVEAAVMIEANWHSMVDELWLVVASRAAVLSRVAAQRGLGVDAIESRIKAQMSDEERRRHADVVIDNSGTPDELKETLRQLWEHRVVGSQI